LLRNPTGLRYQVTFCSPSEDAATGISLWYKASSAEIYSKETYLTVLKELAAWIEGTRKVDTYEVVNSTDHHIACAAVA
jgi:hypothetical protein